MNGDNGTSAPHNAQLRALLFTDLCDSLQLVERIGDVAAAEFFQQHDRLVLGLQQQWNGQLIDRSDGLFVLFERPIDGIGFAISYQNAVDAMGHERGIVLRARAGLHVGDVLLWDNSAEAVAHGAKAVEVEGLAKPMAARLMQLAWPGQVLLSSAAEQMARRADSELPWAADELRWKDHGLWRFKG
ncbi:MAG: putative peptide modification system cyclase, partial [Stenotrophomonas indicatrix]